MTVYSHFWRASHQQVYRELGRLGTEGRVNAKGKIYSLTQSGLEELREWILTPTAVPRTQYDML